MSPLAIDGKVIVPPIRTQAYPIDKMGAGKLNCPPA